MHEYSVLQSLLQSVEEQVRAHRASRVHAIHLRIGELSGVEVELLERAWTLFERDPTWGEASLEIETVPALYRCPQCERAFERGQILRCPDCQRPARMISGDEILLQRIEMEVP